MLQYLVLFGAAAQMLGIMAYVRDTVKGVAKPNRVTWLMWAVAPIIATLAALSNGVRWAILPVFAAGFGPLLVFIASFANPKAYWRLTRFDYLCGFFSLLALVLWGITNNPVVAIVFSILSDALAGFPTLIKAYKHPETENPAPFVTGLLSQATSFFAMKTWSFSEYSFPIYLVIMNALLIGALLRSRSRYFPKKNP